MAKIRLIHDTIGRTLTVWLGDPASEHSCEETTDELVVMKDRAGKIIGVEILHYEPGSPSPALAVESTVETFAA